MNWMLGLALYFVIWWTLLFAVLPFGIISQQEAKDIVPGSDPGAPVSPHLLPKLLINTVVSAAVWLALYLAYTTFYPRS